MKYAMRSMFVPAKGKIFLAFDLSQAETWIVAYLANEPNMKDALLNGEIHTHTASVLYSVPETEVTKTQRYAGKQNNHASSYRMGANRLVEVFNKNSDKPPYLTITSAEGKRMHRIWHEHYHLKTWWDDIEYQLSKNQKTLVTPYGRKRTFYMPWGDELFKEATAHVPQSTVGDHTLGAVQPELGIEGGLLSVHRMFKRHTEIRLVHTAHDSIMLEVPIGSELDIAGQVYSCFHRPLVVNYEELTIPVDCEVGERWGQLEKVPRQKFAA